MGQTAGGIEIAGRLVVFVVIVDALILHRRVGGDDAVVQSGDGGTHLVGGAWGIGLHQSPVQHGGVGGFHKLVIVLGEGGKVKAGVGGAGQHLAGPDIQHNHCAALGVLAFVLGPDAVLMEIFDIALEGFLCDHLVVDVYGRFHIGAGLGLHGIILGNDVARTVYRGPQNAVGAVKLLLEGFFQPVLAHKGIHGIALILEALPLFRIHGGSAPQNMGGIAGVDFPDSAGLHLHTGCVELHERCQLGGIHVGEQGVGGQGGIVPKVQLVTQPQNASHLFVCPVVGNAEAIPHQLDQLGGGYIGIPVVFPQKTAEMLIPGFGVGPGFVLIGLGRRDGKMIHIGDVQLPAEANQLPQALVGFVGVEQAIAGDDDVIAGPVAHQHIAVSIQNFAPGGGNAGIVGVGSGGDGPLAGIDHLQLNQPIGEEADQQKEEAQKQPQPQLEVIVHSAPRFC